MGELLQTPIPFTDVPAIFPIIVVALWFLLRNRSTELSPESGIDGVIGQGQPVVLEFFRNT